MSPHLLNVLNMNILSFCINDFIMICLMQLVDVVDYLYLPTINAHIWQQIRHTLGYNKTTQRNTDSKDELDLTICS